MWKGRSKISWTVVTKCPPRCVWGSSRPKLMFKSFMSSCTAKKTTMNWSDCTYIQGRRDSQVFIHDLQLSNFDEFMERRDSAEYMPACIVAYSSNLCSQQWVPVFGLHKHQPAQRQNYETWHTLGCSKVGSISQGIQCELTIILWKSPSAFLLSHVPLCLPSFCSVTMRSETGNCPYSQGKFHSKSQRRLLKQSMLPETKNSMVAAITWFPSSCCTCIWVYKTKKAGACL